MRIARVLRIGGRESSRVVQLDGLLAAAWKHMRDTTVTELSANASFTSGSVPRRCGRARAAPLSRAIPHPHYSTRRPAPPRPTKSRATATRNTSHSSKVHTARVGTVRTLRARPPLRSPLTRRRRRPAPHLVPCRASVLQLPATWERHTQHTAHVRLVLYYR